MQSGTGPDTSTHVQQGRHISQVYLLQVKINSGTVQGKVNVLLYVIPTYKLIISLLKANFQGFAFVGQ